MPTPLEKEISSCCTFAAIAYLDVGKIILIEKLLLYGGAIHVTRVVKNNRIKKSVTGDFMEIECQRGTSVATSVMGFNYKDYKVNILGTPGHRDFAEDTCRVFIAVDSVIIIIDHVKGAEQQTRRLMEAYRIRHTPAIVFINKLDREGLDPFDLLDEVEQELGIVTTPMVWPTGMGDRSKGVYNILDHEPNLFTPNKQHVAEDIHHIESLDLPDLVQHIGAAAAERFAEEVEMIEGVYPKFDHDAYLAGEQALVFPGSVLNIFGVRGLLDIFVRIAPSPQSVQAEEGEVSPYERDFIGSVFEIHASVDPNHRSCIVLVKVRSGRFERNAYHRYTRLDKQVHFSSPTAFMANKEEVIDDVYVGDIVGLLGTGLFRTGDTLASGEMLYFKGLPSFSPEYFKYIEDADPMKQKQLIKGTDQLIGEGVV